MFKKGETGTPSPAAAGDPSTSRPAWAGRRPEPTPVGPTLRIEGEIVGNEDLIVHGRVAGRVDLGDGLLVVTKDGQVDADVNARVITVEGRATGELRATEQIIVRRSGRVQGRIAAPRIALDFGCAFSGAIETEEAAPARECGADDKIADFKAAISGVGQAGAGKGSPR